MKTKIYLITLLSLFLLSVNIESCSTKKKATKYTKKELEALKATQVWLKKLGINETLKALKELKLEGTKVIDAEVKKLKKALPEYDISK